MSGTDDAVVGRPMTQDKWDALCKVALKQLRDLVRSVRWEADGECPSDARLHWCTTILLASILDASAVAACGRGCDPVVMHDTIDNMRLNAVMGHLAQRGSGVVGVILEETCAQGGGDPTCKAN